MRLGEERPHGNMRGDREVFSVIVFFSGRIGNLLEPDFLCFSP